MATDTAEEFVYDLGSDACLVMRELVPEMHTQGPNKCYREKATDDFTGWTIWAAATLLARWIIARPEVFAGKDVIELGAGCGVTGLAAACCTHARSVCLSDYPRETMENLLYNTARNCERAPGGLEGRVPPPAQVSGAASTGPITATLAGRTFSLADAFTSRTGARVSVAQLDWDHTDTWPRRQDAASGSGCGGGPGYAQYDVVVCADLFYRRSYSRKVATAITSLLRPGGIVVAATPTSREGLQTLDTMMAAAGFAADEAPFPSCWRVNPLRTPRPTPAMLAGCDLHRLGLTPIRGPWETKWDEMQQQQQQRGGNAEVDGSGSGSGCGDDDCASSTAGDIVVPLEGPDGAPAPSLHFVSDARSKGMFPEMFVPSYEIVSIVFTPRPAAAAADVNDEDEGGGSRQADHAEE